jgi:hypothetical protein
VVDAADVPRVDAGLGAELDEALHHRALRLGGRRADLVDVHSL